LIVYIFDAFFQKALPVYFRKNISFSGFGVSGQSIKPIQTANKNQKFTDSGWRSRKLKNN